MRCRPAPERKMPNTIRAFTSGIITLAFFIGARKRSGEASISARQNKFIVHISEWRD
jgi:hypothetical protein